MATPFNAFPQAHQFKFYSGPPPPKPVSRRSKPKSAQCAVDDFPGLDQVLEGVQGSILTSEDKEILGPPFRTVETVDLTDLDGLIGNRIGDESGGEGCDLNFQNDRVEESDESSSQPTRSEGSNPENAVVIDDSQTELDIDGEDEHQFWENDEDIQTNIQFEGVRRIAMKQPVESQTVEEVDNPPESTVDGSPPQTSCDGNVKKSVHFAKRVSTDDHTICQPAHLPQPLMEVKGQGEFSTPENTSGSSDSDSDGNVRESNCQTMAGKRKRFQLANTVSRKRHARMTNGPLKQHHRPAAHSTRRQKPFMLSSGPLPSRISVLEPASGAQLGDSEIHYGDENSEESGDRDRRLRSDERPKSIASHDFRRKRESKRNRGSIPPSRSNAESPFPLSTHTSPHATRETRSRPSVKGQAQQHLPNIAIHPFSADVAFLTALFRGHDDRGILSTNRAVKLLEDVVGRSTKFNNITIRPLAPGGWFLTCFTYCSSDTAGHRIDKLAPALLGLLATSIDAVAPRGNNRSSTDESSSDGNESDDDYDEHLRKNDNGPSSSAKHSPWLQEDEDLLRKWKKEGKPWEWICSQFPGRSSGAVRLRWYMKLRKKP